MMQTSNLTHCPMPPSYLGEGHNLPFSHPRIGQNHYSSVCPQVFATLHAILYKSPIHILIKAHKQPNPPPLKCPAVTSNLTALGGRYLYSLQGIPPKWIPIKKQQSRPQSQCWLETLSQITSKAGETSGSSKNSSRFSR